LLLVILVLVVAGLIVGYFVTRRPPRAGEAEEAYLAQADLRRESAQRPIDRSGY
jgi:hypothetical protein